MSRNETLLLGAFAIALTATLGALFAGEVLGQTPCNLCWYQRIAMFPLAVILGVAAFRGDFGARWYALPLAVAGMFTAAWHTGLYVGLVPAPIVPCTRDGPSCTSDAMLLFGLPLPVMALVSFAAISSLMLMIKEGDSK